MCALGNDDAKTTVMMERDGCATYSIIKHPWHQRCILGGCQLQNQVASCQLFAGRHTARKMSPGPLMRMAATPTTHVVH